VQLKVTPRTPRAQLKILKEPLRVAASQQRSVASCKRSPRALHATQHVSERSKLL
jgi:hypothetical protein